MAVRVLSSHLTSSGPMKWSITSVTWWRHIDNRLSEAVERRTSPCASARPNSRCNHPQTRSFYSSLQSNCRRPTSKSHSNIGIINYDSCGLLERLRLPGSVMTTSCRTMAGHSHWANIKHTKASADQTKSAVNAKMAYRLKVAIKEGGSSDPAKNTKLQSVIADAKKLNVPKATVDRVLLRAAASLQTFYMEIPGPEGSVLIAEVECANRTQAKSSINSSLKKFGLQTDSLHRGRHIFDEKGVVSVVVTTAMQPINMDRYLEVAIESGAEDVIVVEETMEDGPQQVLKFHCEPMSMQSVKTEIENCELEISSAEVEYMAKQWVNLSPGSMELLEKVFTKLANNELVVRTFDNITVPTD